MRTYEDRLVTLKETGQRLELSVGTLRLWISKKKLAAVKLGRVWRVPVSEIDRLIAEGTRER